MTLDKALWLDVVSRLAEYSAAGSPSSSGVTTRPAGGAIPIAAARPPAMLTRSVLVDREHVDGTLG